MDNIKFLLAKEKHVDMMYEIEKDSFITPWSYKSMHNDVTKHDIAIYLVALDNNDVVGYLGIWHVIDQAHITTIAIKKEYRRQTIGETLLLKMLNKLRKINIIEVTLEVRESNSKAINLYKKLGFYCEGKRINYYQDTNEDAIIMWKKL